MNTTLVMMTSSYPFSASAEQTFVEPELGKHIDSFERVIVVPASMEGEKAGTFPKVEVDISLAEHLRQVKGIKREMKELLSSFSTSMFFHELRTRPWIVKHPVLVWCMMNAFGAARATEDWLETFIERRGIRLRNTVFYTYWFDDQTLGLAMLKRRIGELKIVTRAHAYDLYEDRHPCDIIPGRREALDLVDKIFVISEFGSSYLAGRYGDRVRQKVTIARLGVNPAKKVSEESKDGKIRVVSCSFLNPNKRIELIIEGLYELSIMKPDLDVEWVHFGEGPLRADLENLAECRFRDQVKYKFMGATSNSQIMRFYEETPVDIFLNTSKSEGIPVTIMEAHSHAIPSIAPMVGGVGEIVTNSNGVLMSSNPTPKEIADAVLSLIKDERVFALKRTEALKNWANMYNSESNYADFSNQLLSLD